MSQVTARPVVPVSFRQQIFSSIHNIAHPGIRASKAEQAADFGEVRVEEDGITDS